MLLGDLGYVGFPKTSGGRGIHIYVRIEPRWSFTDVRHAAIAFGRELERRLPGEVTTNWWKEERGERIFVDYNQNARDRTIASAYSIRPKPGAPVSAPVTWDELADVAPEDFTVATMPARFAEIGDRHAAIDDVAHSLQPLLDLYERDEAEGERRHALSTRLSEDAGRAQARAAVARPRSQAVAASARAALSHARSAARAQPSAARMRASVCCGLPVICAHVMRRTRRPAASSCACLSASCSRVSLWSCQVTLSASIATPCARHRKSGTIVCVP